jgi:cytochrome P450
MLGWLLQAEGGGEKLSCEDIHDILGLLIIAGQDTVAASLACFLSSFARHPEHRAQVVADPSGWPRVVEELMRFESPVTEGGRIALDDLELPSGITIPAGTLMIASWSAADLDPK